jgi:ATP synthase F1 delta subunit
MLQVNITSATPLSVAQKEKLEQALEKKYLSETIQVTYQVKTELIAGLSVSVAGKLYDASLQARLKRLASQI